MEVTPSAPFPANLKCRSGSAPFHREQVWPRSGAEQSQQVAEKGDHSRLCERSEAIQRDVSRRTQLFLLYSQPISGSLRRFAPRNDGGKDFFISFEPEQYSAFRTQI
jgi:hypothetical protein